MTSNPDLQPAVAAEFMALADVLAGATADQWDTPSLCEGWRVREVVAHLTMAARYSDEAFMAELQRYGFDFTRLSNDIAGRDAELPVSELVSNLRSDVLHHWAPPEGGFRGSLSHVVIHGLDVTVPLGMPRLCADDDVRVVLDSLVEGGRSNHFGIDLEGRRLEATDLDWSYGAGRELRGRAEWLVLALSGRTVPPGRIDGAPLH